MHTHDDSRMRCNITEHVVILLYCACHGFVPWNVKPHATLVTEWDLLYYSGAYKLWYRGDCKQYWDRQVGVNWKNYCSCCFTFYV